MLSVLEILQKTAAFFATRGIEHPRLDAELLVGHALGLKRMELYLQFERLLPEAELEKIRPLVRRRGQREPLQYVLGEVEFHGLKLVVDRRALIPRPETELLVELVVQRVEARPPQAILDLGTGSGAIALALAARFPEAGVLAVDASADALALAGENARRLGLDPRVELRESNWFDAIPPPVCFDLIVSNPPYLTEAETAEAAPEVRDFEPWPALTAADEGRAELRRIIDAAPGRLCAGGLLAFETGISHHAELLTALAAAGLTATESVRDLTGRDRFVFARAP